MYLYIPSKIEWDLANGHLSVSCDRAIRYSGYFGVRSVGPTVGDFLDTWNIHILHQPDLDVFCGLQIQHIGNNHILSSALVIMTRVC